jgi:iron complex outermembrane receptor protein
LPRSASRQDTLLATTVSRAFPAGDSARAGPAHEGCSSHLLARDPGRKAWHTGAMKGSPLSPRAAASLVALLALAVATERAAGESGDAQPLASTLEPIVVTASRSPESLEQVPAAVSVVTRPDIQEARETVSLAEPLDRVPGVFVQDSGNFAQDARIQIRGFGTRSAFGIREIKILVDGLPETLPDGSTELDAIDLGAMDHIEVLRGPGASLYGNASGGVIQLFTQDAPSQPQVEARPMGGSFGLAKYQLKGGGQAGPASLFFQSSYFEEAGYRDHSRTRATTVNTKLRYELDADTDLTLLLNGVDSPVADDPGALTRAEADANPRQARSSNEQLDAGEAVQQGRIGLVARRRMSQGKLSAYAYSLYRDFDSHLPIPPDTPPIQGGVVKFDRFSPGAGFRYLAEAPLLGRPNRLSLGFDTQYQDDERRRYSNVNGQQGVLGLHQDERVTSAGPYVHDAFSLRDDLELSFGLRYDTIHFATDVDFPPDSGQSGSRTFDAWSPAGGVLFSPRPWISTFADIATAFQVPTTTELANPSGGGFNPNLEPQTAISYEIGARAEQPRMRAEIAAFLIDVSNELVPFELASQPERMFFRNAGRSRRYGLELAWEATPFEGLRWTSSLTLLHARYLDYRTDSGDFAGKQEPGIPSWQLYEELAYHHPSGLFVALEAFLVSDYFVDDPNSTRARTTALCNLRAGYSVTRGRFSIEPFLGLNNLSDTSYDARIRANAQGMRFFEPGAGFNVYGGVTVVARL